MRNVIARSRKAEPATSKAWWRQSLTLFLLFLTLAFLAACGGDDSSSVAPNNDEPSSSSVVQNSSSAKSSSSATSRSSEKDLSSSGAAQNDDEPPSSSVIPDSDPKSGKNVKSSSSSADEMESLSSNIILSSSEESIPSSSSVILVTPCKSETEDNCEYGTLLDDRDDQTYKTVKISDQWWIAENLNFETENSWCGGGSGTTEGDCSVYGRLYTWDAATSACPGGWHLPSYDEWDALFTAVGGSSTAGSKLKSATGWKSSGNGTDDFGFSVFPVGYRDYDDANFRYRAVYVFFWSSTEYKYSSGSAHYMHFVDDEDEVVLLSGNKNYAYSVRCIKD